MVAEVIPQADNSLLSEDNVKTFFDSEEYGTGILHISEEFLLWESKTNDKRLKLLYPSISLHAVSTDTSSFPYECIYCLYETGVIIESEEESDPYPQVSQIRFVPSDSTKLKELYDTIAYCQTLHPDENDEESAEEMENDAEYQQVGTLDGFYTADSNFDDIELSEEGQAVLERLQQNLNISNGKTDGQFDDADDSKNNGSL